VFRADILKIRQDFLIGPKQQMKKDKRIGEEEIS
jgi:hypothetical protein